MGVFGYFGIEGPNGKYRCIVIGLLGPGLGSLESVDARLPLDIGKKITAQVVRAGWLKATFIVIYSLVFGLDYDSVGLK